MSSPKKYIFLIALSFGVMISVVTYAGSLAFHWEMSRNIWVEDGIVVSQGKVQFLPPGHTRYSRYVTEDKVREFVNIEKMGSPEIDFVFINGALVSVDIRGGGALQKVGPNTPGFENYEDQALEALHRARQDFPLVANSSPYQP